MFKGKVKWFDAAKGFGFINEEGDTKDIFVHYSEIKQDGYRSLNEGDDVEFEIYNSDKGPQAQQVRKI